jgi:hypothetical protein
MKVFATNYLESMTENSDGDNGTGRPTKTMMDGGNGRVVIPVKDEDMPQEGMENSMLVV